MAGFVGGTGSANQLDDYEEGSWTPAFGHGETLSISLAQYTKTVSYTHLTLPTILLV